MLKIAYGYTPEDHHDPIIHLNEKAMDPVSRATDPAGFLVNQIHFSQLVSLLHKLIQSNTFFNTVKHIPAWVPGANFRRLAESWRQDYLAMVRIPFENVVKQHVCCSILLSSAYKASDCINRKRELQRIRLPLNGCSKLWRQKKRNCSGIRQVSCIQVRKRALAMERLPTNLTRNCSWCRNGGFHPSLAAFIIHR